MAVPSGSPVRDLVSQPRQCLLQALGGDRLVLGECDGQAVVRIDLPGQPVADHHDIPAVLVAELQDLRPEQAVAPGTVASRSLQPGRQRTVIHAEPPAALAEVRTGAHRAGQLHPALREPGADLLPVIEDAGLLHEENVAVLLMGVWSVFAAVEVGPPERLALAAVVAHGRVHHGDGLNVRVRAAVPHRGTEGPSRCPRGAELRRPVQEVPDGGLRPRERGTVLGVRCRLA